MGRGLGSIGPTLVLALLGLPLAVLAGLWWRIFDRQAEETPIPDLDDLPVVEAIAEV